MTHLKIEQNTTGTEEVNTSIIAKLYELAISGDLDETSDLKGRLHSTIGYDTEVVYLNEHFSDLHISVDKALLPFKESWILDKMVAYCAGTQNYQLAQQIASDGGFTRETANAIENPSFYGFNIIQALSRDEWKTVKSFKELAYFPYITGLNSAHYQFQDLEEIDCSNITTFDQYGTNFNGCSNLRTFIYNPAVVTSFSNLIFYGCSNLNIDINFPNNTASCESSFDGSGIVRVLNPGPGLTLSGEGQYGRGGFMRCRSLKYISIPYTCTGESHVLAGNTDDGCMFNDCRLLECVIFNCQSVFQLGTTNHFNNTNNTFKIYVPDSLVNNYKSDTYWSNWSSRIYGISQLQTDNAEYYQLWQDYTDHSGEPTT